MVQQAEAQPNLPKKRKEPRFGSRLPKFPKTRLSKEGAGRAHEKGWLDMGLGKGSSGSDDSAEKHHQEECRRAAAERTKRLKQGLAMTGKEHCPVDAEARAKLLGEVEPSDLDRSPWEICIHVTVTAYNKPSC